MSPPEKAHKPHKKKQKKALLKPSIEIGMEQLTVPHIRTLASSIVLNRNVSNGWFKMIKPEDIKQVVVAVAPGLLYSDIDSCSTLEDKKHKSLNEIELNEQFEPLKCMFQTRFFAMLPGSKDSTFSPFHAISHIPRTKAAVRELRASKLNIDLNDLLLTDQQMEDSNYPLKLSAQESKEGWCTTESPPSLESLAASQTPKLFGLDCEFCMSELGNELTRISLVNGDSEVILDTFVQPENPIIDYKTQYSGITPELLEGITTTIGDVQKEILSIVSSEDYLVGHSLNSDLNVLKIYHRRIIDTAHIYDHPRGPPLKASLKWLAKTYLNRVIQNGDNGHCLVEDSSTCIDLVKLKLKSGLYFGSTIDTISLKEQLIQEHKVKIDVLNGGDKYSDDDAIIKAAIDSIESAETPMVMLHLQDLERERGWSKWRTLQTEQQQSPVDQGNTQLVSRISQVYDLLPVGSLFILLGNSVSPVEMYRLQERKQRYQRSTKEGKDDQLNSDDQWDDAKETLLRETVEQVRSGFCMIGLKEHLQDGVIVNTTTKKRK
ncbi:uncharacterized protein KQ657_004370 [Scheffersomyces spartinae]|uniref:Exonuclease domain-containing protein n=1 Tax=Scheffersomyces spartinae TaxID=45513 RepID=A0A9P7VB13_9ASCO|nr:uncharacterized protein KQ657_004370 [Scheffersomyces spartinae]KAG7194693.1 hypothetical protein KQ657_004370 [Scheffersomyces spartinae]